jgi:hypothetical protein
MDWLRSEDLKEEKEVTTSKSTIARQEGFGSFQIEPGPVATSPFVSSPFLHSCSKDGCELPELPGVCGVPRLAQG